MITPVLRGYTAENKHFTTLAIGCTGGKHRSVAVSEKIGDLLRRAGHAVRIRHRDLGRRSEEHTSELQSRGHLVCRLLPEKKKKSDAVHDTGEWDSVDA